MGLLNDSLVHIGFNRPELFRVIFNPRTKRPQAAVVSITQAFPFPPLNGSVNPTDGQLYVAGFQVRRLGHDLDPPRRPWPRALHGAPIDTPAGSDPDGTRRAAAL
jgi:hypothetical protein